MAAWNAQQAQNQDWYWALPLAGDWGDTQVGTTGFTIRELAPQNWDWYSHPSYDSYWATIDVEQHWVSVVVPALISGGWFDLCQVGTIRNYMGMRAHGGSALARDGTMLVMDCCGHGLPYQGLPGINWGPNRTNAQLTQQFFDYYVNGVDNGFKSQPRVQLTVLVPPDSGTQGGNFILYANDYPIPGTTYARYYLSSGGNANTRLGDGVLLDPTRESQESSDRSRGSPDHFAYDPANPVPTAGGNDGGTVYPVRAVDQSVVELRDDVLVYTSAPLEEQLAVIGPITVRFWAISSAPDTDFTAKLVDVHPDGYAHNVADRIIRARYRAGPHSPPQLIKPGQAYEYEIYVGDTATMFKPGHRIRLEISSSNFPHYARNLNTGLSNEDTDQIAIANQAILHDASHPSYLQIPIAPRSGEDGD
jgi:putative CocE/NonD family hydrolase